MYRAALVFLLFVTPAVVRCDTLERLMPGEQAALVVKVQAAQETKRAADFEPNGLKKKEGLEKAARACAEADLEMYRLRKADGLTEWVFECTGVSTVSAKVKVGDSMELAIGFDGMSEAVKKAVRELEPGDVVKVTTVREAGLIGRPASPTTLSQTIAGRWVKSVEKVAAK